MEGTEVPNAPGKRGVCCANNESVASSSCFDGVLTSSLTEGCISGDNECSSEDNLEPLADVDCRGDVDTLVTRGERTGEERGERRMGNVKLGATALCKRARSASARAIGPFFAVTEDGGEVRRWSSRKTGDIERSGR